MIQYDGQVRWYVKQKRFIFWRCVCTVHRSQLGNMHELKIFDSPKQAIQEIKQMYGSSANIQNNYL